MAIWAFLSAFKWQKPLSLNGCVACAGRPDLAEPAHVSIATAAEVAVLLPASHWICGGLRGRSFEERGLLVRFQVRHIFPAESSACTLC